MVQGEKVFKLVQVQGLVNVRKRVVEKFVVFLDLSVLKIYILVLGDFVLRVSEIKILFFQREGKVEGFWQVGFVFFGWGGE